MEKKGRRNSIGRRTLVGIIVFALVIVIAVSVPVCYGYYVLTVKHHQEDTISYAGITAHAIDGDRIAEYADTGQKDEYYDDIEAFLKAFIDDADLSGISVFVPDEDGVAYLWDTGLNGQKYDLGSREAYNVDRERIIRSVFSKTPEEVVFITQNPDGEEYLNAFVPVYDSKGDPAAVVRVVQQQPHTSTVIAQFIFIIALVTALAAAIAMLIAYNLLRKMLIKPIEVLTEGAEEMVGNLEREEPISIEVHTNDELETLAEAFTAMDMDMRDYIKELSIVTAEKERITTELDLASRIQSGMLPKLVSPFNDNEKYELYATMTPAKEVGGDFYDFFMVDDRHIALVMADVSGKGIPGALMMMVSKILIKNSVKAGKSPAEALGSVNRTILESNDTFPFVTVWLAVIDLESGEGVAVNAGHEHPALRRKGGDYELIKYKHSPAVGTVEELQYREHDFALKPGDSLFVYTDGVTEAVDSHMNAFGNDRLIEALNGHKDADPEELLPAVKAEIDAFAGDADQFDDITMLAFRLNA